MARTLGSRSKQYAARRSALLAKIRARLVEPNGSRASLRDMALAGDVTMPTLKHYFPDRNELICAVLDEHLSAGKSHLEHIATPRGTFAQSVREALAYTMTGFRYGGLGEVHSLGLVEGLGNETVGPMFVKLVLEPSIAALQRRLDAHVRIGEMRAIDTRHAALSLLSPIVVAMLHQAELGGRADHPLDPESLVETIAEGFVRGHATTDLQ